MAKEANIQLKNIIKEFQTHDGAGVFRAVDNISIDIESGNFITLLGPSGCGKTTMLRMIAGFENPSSGDIILNGETITGKTPDKRDTAMVFQSYALFPHYNVYDNVAYGLVNKQLAKNVIHEKVMSMLDLVGLKGLEERQTNQLSGGQQQRVALARALVMEPAVLLFDEPLSNLDAKLRVYMRREIRKIQQRIGLTSIYVTHDQAEAMNISDKIIIMNQGHIEQIGSPAEIYQYPETKFVADFIGNANFAEGTVVSIDNGLAKVNVFGAVIDIEVDENKISAGDEVYVVIRPEAIEFTEEPGVKAVVTSSTFMGAVQEYVLEVGGVELNMDDFCPVDKKVYAAGAEVNVRFKIKSLHAIKKMQEVE